MKDMRRVIIESPYAGDIKRNVAYARAAMADSLRKGEAPFASHLLYTQVLFDDLPLDREKGMLACLEWADACDAVVVYGDLGISPGMQRAIDNAKKWDIPVEHRFMPEWLGQWTEMNKRVPKKSGVEVEVLS